MTTPQLDPLVVDDAETLLRILGDTGDNLWIGDTTTTAVPNYSALDAAPYRVGLYDRS